VPAKLCGDRVPPKIAESIWAKRVVREEGRTIHLTRG
jgi:hypothetical protein